MNTVVLHGHVRNEPVERSLRDGSLLVSFDLVTDRHRGVPVVWTPTDDAPSDDGRLHVGDELVVVGSVGRRFFRSGTTTVWRTDVVADQVITVRSRRALQRRLDAIAEAVLGLAQTGRVRSASRARRVDDTT